MKTIKKIYGNYATKYHMRSMLDTAELSISILKMRRNDIVRSKLGLHDENLDAVIKALDFWVEIENQCKEFIR